MYTVFKISNDFSDRTYIGYSKYSNIQDIFQNMAFYANKGEHRYGTLKDEIKNYGVERFKIEKLQGGIKTEDEAKSWKNFFINQEEPYYNLHQGSRNYKAVNTRPPRPPVSSYPSEKHFTRIA